MPNNSLDSKFIPFISVFPNKIADNEIGSMFEVYWACEFNQTKHIELRYA